MIFEEKKIGDYGNIVSFLLYLEVSDETDTITKSHLSIHRDTVKYIFVIIRYIIDARYL